MTDIEAGSRARAGRRARGANEPSRTHDRQPNYRRLVNSFLPQPAFSADQVNAIHDSALRVLEELGVKILLPEARRLFASAGALVNEEDQMVRIGRDIVESALKSAPKSFEAKGGIRERDLLFELGSMMFVAGCGAPNVTDLDRGRRSGSIQAFEELVKLTQSYDILHLHGPHIEPQDVELRFRHYATMRAQLTYSDKLPFIFSRGTGQVEQSFELVALARGLGDDAFRRDVHCFTIVNTNSPRQLDVPMAQGIIDFARHRQMVIVTPFCLAGAMAPISVAGALTLQHAEALMGITLSQIVNPGAPVVYGSFSSNVDMKSGAPAFGTPEHAKATLGAGQLARHIGLPWRSGGGSAANVADAQAASETQFALWGSVLAGATVCIHAAGWLEGGLSVSLEKTITDMEAMQQIAEMFTSVPGDADDIGFEAIAEVQPGGHFFSAKHTMERYRTAFYQPLVADWSNFGSWTESGSKTATVRANEIWKRTLENFAGIAGADEIASKIDERVAVLRQQGGAEPMN